VIGGRKRELDRLWSIVNDLQTDSKTIAKLVEQMDAVIERLDALTTSKTWRLAQGLAFAGAIAADTLSHIIK
jgi:hypothetical protein